MEARTKQRPTAHGGAADSPDSPGERINVQRFSSATASLFVKPEGAEPDGQAERVRARIWFWAR